MVSSFERRDDFAYTVLFSDLFWVDVQDGELPRGVTSVYVDNNEVARAWVGQDLIGGRILNGKIRGALDGQAFKLHGGYQV